MPVLIPSGRFDAPASHVLCKLFSVQRIFVAEDCPERSLIMKKAWILSGIIGIGAVALPPGIARAADRDERDRYDYKDRDVRDDLDYYRRQIGRAHV